MNAFNQQRIRSFNEQSTNTEGEFVLYWMQMYRRFEYNFALQFAVERANSLGKPLLIYEGLSASYPWANDRFHTFLMQGMQENLRESLQQNWNYFSFIEKKEGEGKGLVYVLCSSACEIITDDYPVFIMRKHNKRLTERLSLPLHLVDGNGLIPFGYTEKAPYSAYLFRKVMQKHFVDAITSMPDQHPLSRLENTQKINLETFLPKKWLHTVNEFPDISTWIKAMDIDHSVSPIQTEGTRKAALEHWQKFLNQRVKQYEKDRNHPDKRGTSGMSGWLHFGKVSQHELVADVLSKQPASWSLDEITLNKGSRDGFFNGNDSIDGFLDELITWREVGYHYCHHVENYDAYESLPDWVRTTLAEHESDTREYIYSLEQFEKAQTHDKLWNAAQRELVREGRIHNYLRMLWGKKILEWTPNAREALDIMIELNNKYAIDGRDPNSYSGIFWVLGRFDRAWQERAVFGKVRYMTSESTMKKVNVQGYLKRYEFF